MRRLSTSTSPEHSLPALDATKPSYYRARYYDQTSGRFITEDPTGFVGGINFYRYVGNNPVGRIDPLGLDWLNNLADFSAGAGSVLSFGLTDRINDATGASSVVNQCSGWHTFGAVTGFALATAIGGAEGLEEGLEKSAGDQWSHWIPDRAKDVPAWIRDSKLNGRYMSKIDHMLNDPKAYQFMPKSLKPEIPINPAWLRQWNRVPPWLKGAGVGAGLGGSSVALNGHDCGCH